MRIEPIGEKVVVKRLDATDVTAGGLVLPDAARERSQQGRVLSVGAGRLLADGRRQPPAVREGDRVIFSSFAGAEIKLNGEAVLIMSDGDILAVIE